MTWYELTNLHVFFVCINIIMWVTLYKAVTLDPGFVPTDVPEYHQAVKQVGDSSVVGEVRHLLPSGI